MSRPWLRLTKKKERKKYDNDAFYQSTAWRKLSKLQKEIEPMCRHCWENGGKLTEGEISDHIKPVNERPDLALNLTNLQTLCRACHNRKTAKEGK